MIPVWKGARAPASGAWPLIVVLAFVGTGCAGVGDTDASIRAYLDAVMIQNARALDTIITTDYVQVDNGHRFDRDRFIETWREGQPLEVRYRVENVSTEIVGDLAVAEIDLKWYRRDGMLAQQAASVFTLRDDGGWKVQRVFSASLPVGPLPDTTGLGDYVGRYRLQNNVVEVERRGDRLISFRPGGEKWVGGLKEAALLPGGGDRYYLEITNSLIEFVRDDDSTVVGLMMYEPFSARGFPFEKIH
jgi:hypothetical protein